MARRRNPVVQQLLTGSHITSVLARHGAVGHDGVPLAAEHLDDPRCVLVVDPGSCCEAAVA